MSETISSNSKPIDRMQWPALGIGMVALAGVAAWGTRRPDIFFRAYLFGWLFWLAVSLGGMALASLHYLTGGNWGRLGRGIAESAATLIPLNGILFIPVLFGVKYIFPWADPTTVHGDSVLIHRAHYMNLHWFTIRYVIYFVVWTTLAYAGIRLARSYDRTRSEITYDRLRKVGAGYLVCFIGLMTLAAVDWIMSREPHWTSSIFGFIICVDQTLTALLFVIIILSQLVDRPPLGDFVRPSYLIDLGNLLLTLVVLWAYMNFAQFLITWTGNEQEDIGWYIQRTRGGWKVIAGLLIYLHFFVPFLMLLSRDIKGNIKRLACLCAFLLALRVLDLYWLMTPAGKNPLPTVFGPEGSFSFMEVLTWIGIGGIYMSAFLYVLHSRPLLSQPFPEETEQEAIYGSEATQPH